MIARCTCDYPAQDQIYGRGMRLFNDRLNGKAPRCTVCGKDGPKPGSDGPKKK